MLSDCLPPQALSLGTSEHKILLEEGHRTGLELKQSRSPFLRTVVTLSALSRQMMHTPFIHDSTLMGSVTFPFSLAGCTWWEYEMPWRAVGRSSGWMGGWNHSHLLLWHLSPGLWDPDEREKGREIQATAMASRLKFSAVSSSLLSNHFMILWF